MNKIHDEIYENLIDIPRITSFNDCEFINCHFEAADLSGKEFNDCCFFGCDFGKANFAKAKFINCRFTDCNLKDVQFTADIEVMDVQFDKCTLNSSRSSKCTW